MTLKHRILCAPPSSNNFDRVFNWCERNVKNYYALSGSVQPTWFTPLQLLAAKAGPAWVDIYRGVHTYAVLENNRINGNSLPMPRLPGVVDTIFGASLDVHQ